MSDTEARNAVSAPDLEPTVTVELRPGREAGYAAVVDVCGEPDIATSDDVAEALRGLEGSVLVDLAECRFLDSSVISVLLADLRRRTHEGYGLDLVPQSNRQISRILQVSSIRSLRSVHEHGPPLHERAQRDATEGVSGTGASSGEGDSGTDQGGRFLSPMRRSSLFVID
jgi:anti-anti-sigma regulatory factor